ncbi:5606_t:CDS:2, partial [Funneliformis geosporum]
DEDSNSETETNINPLYEVENKIIPIQNEKESEDASIDYENDENDISLSNIFNLPHPAIDKNAKWKLQDIFIEDLEPTNYFKIFINNN